MDFFVAGTPYPKHKAGGAVEEAERWTRTITDSTRRLPPITYPCTMSLEYQIPPDRFTPGSPYGPDLDNLTKRLLDSLKPTILKNSLGEDGCIMDLRVSKRVVTSDAQVGVRVSVEPLREGVNDEEFLYFAYGSNMQYQRLKERVHNLRKVSNVFTPNYKMRTNKIGKDGSGKANIESDEKSLVWGVLWAIPKTSQPNLDEAEGYHQGRHDSHYKHETIIVFDEGLIPWKAMTYIACNGRVAGNDLPVNPDYYNFIVEGAKENGLPEEYIEQVEKMRVRTR